MKSVRPNRSWASAIVIGFMVAGVSAAAEPSWAAESGHGKNQRPEQSEHGKSRQQDSRASRDAGRREVRSREYFGDRQRTLAHRYYGEEFRRGRCPPGLARKHNGCSPPGHAKRWRVGHQLPRDVIFYDLPPALVVELGRPPRGYRYVRVASDILLITIGTGMVIDAIQDLGAMQ